MVMDLWNKTNSIYTFIKNKYFKIVDECHILTLTLDSNSWAEIVTIKYYVPTDITGNQEISWAIFQATVLFFRPLTI